MEYVVKILQTEYVTHDVKRFIVEKPEDYEFTPGQATYVSINKPGWEDEIRPFTFTSLASDAVLEFIIKIYPEHNGVTKEMEYLESGDELIIREVWGAIHYRGPGVFIAGGVGITPFIAILRQLEYENNLNGNMLIFSNKTHEDIILEHELEQMFRDKVIFTLTQDDQPDYEHRRIDEEFLEEKIDNFDQHFYVCGPPRFVKEITEALKKLGANPDYVVFEK